MLTDALSIFRSTLMRAFRNAATRNATALKPNSPHRIRFSNLQPLLACFLIATGFTVFTPVACAVHETTTRQHSEEDLPAISIIIDDIGYTHERDKRAILLPGAVNYAILPHTPYSVEFALLAHKLGKEVLLHQPMESLDAQEQIHLGPGALKLDMDRQAFIHTFQDNLRSIPYAIGINNHMGSLLTQHPGHMAWLMEAISHNTNLFFVDSYTTAGSVVQQIANENWVLNIRRDVFLDHYQDLGHIKRQFDLLLHTASKNGIALGIAHPYPETLQVLEQQLPSLRKKGYRLLPISRLLQTHTQRFKTWRAFLSP